MEKVASQVVCAHKWSAWFSLNEKDVIPWRMCRGLCQQVHKQNEEEPVVVVALLQ